MHVQAQSADVNTDSRSLVTPSGLLWIRRYHSYSLELKAALNFSLDTFFLLISSSSLPCNFSFILSFLNFNPFFVYPHRDSCPVCKHQITQEQETYDLPYFHLSEIMETRLWTLVSIPTPTGSWQSTSRWPEDMCKNTKKVKKAFWFCCRTSKQRDISE